MIPVAFSTSAETGSKTWLSAARSKRWRNALPSWSGLLSRAQLISAGSRPGLYRTLLATHTLVISRIALGKYRVIIENTGSIFRPLSSEGKRLI